MTRTISRQSNLTNNPPRAISRQSNLTNNPPRATNPRSKQKNQQLPPIRLLSRENNPVRAITQRSNQVMRQEEEAAEAEVEEDLEAAGRRTMRSRPLEAVAATN
jgi:hypothetical protein